MYRRRYLANDPRWITARRSGDCSTKSCVNKIGRGDRAFYYPSVKAIYCATCGDDMARLFEAEAADDDNNRCL